MLRSRMCILKVASVLVAGGACRGQSTPGAPVRLATPDASDTIIINSRWPRGLPVRALDAKGRTVPGAAIRFEWAGGAPLPVTRTGAVTCTSNGDLSVRAVLNDLTSHFVVRCRLVEYVQIPGPIQFILGDSVLSQPRRLGVGVFSADSQPVSVFNADIRLADRSVASLDGATLAPQSRGWTSVSAYIGDREGWTHVHTYQRVDGLDALDTLLRVHPLQRFLAIPLRLDRDSISVLLPSS